MKKVVLIVLAFSTMFLLMACGDKKEENEETNNVESDEVIDIGEDTSKDNLVNEEKNNDEEFFEDIEQARETLNNLEMYSDDSKYIINVTDNTRGIYYHDGEKITGYEIRIEYDSAELAEQARQTYNQEDGDNIKSIKVDGNELIVEFGPEEYEKTSLKDVEAAYSLIKKSNNK